MTYTQAVYLDEDNSPVVVDLTDVPIPSFWTPIPDTGPKACQSAPQCLCGYCTDEAREDEPFELEGE